MDSVSTMYSALVIDDGDEAAKWTGSTPYGFSVKVLRTAGEAETAILDENANYAAIFLGSVLSDSPLRLISQAHRTRPGTPVYLVYDREPPFNQLELNRLAVVEAFSGPLNADHIARRIAPEIFAFQGAIAPRKPMDTVAAEREYSAVPAADFLSGVRSFFDIYVRLASGKFLKVLNALEIFAPSRVSHYMKKGVQSFYIRRESKARCLEYCDLLASNLLNSRNVSQEMKLGTTLSRGNTVIELIRSQGLDLAHLDYVHAFIAQVRSLIKKYDFKEKGRLSVFLKNAAANDHAVSATMIASLLALPLGIESESGFRTVGVATLLHDIGLYELARENPEMRLDSVEVEIESMDSIRDAMRLELYRKHPIRSAEALAKFPEIDDVVTQAVLQHHERKNQAPFATKARMRPPNIIAEIVGISDAFAGVLAKSRLDPAVQWETEMKEKIFPGFSRVLLDAFREVFSVTGRDLG